MPISADPDATAEYSLASDADKPAESRPVFICRFMTRKEHRHVADLVQEAYDTPATPEGDAECYRLLIEAIGIGVVGWRNIAIPFDLSRLDEALSDREFWELARNYPGAVRSTERDRFLSRSQARSAAASPAKAEMPTGAASEPTPPAKAESSPAPPAVVTTAPAGDVVAVAR